MLVNARLYLYLFTFSLVCGFVFGQKGAVPDLSKLAPYCAGTVDNVTDQITLDCSQARSQEQIEELFASGSFHTLQVYKLIIANNQYIQYLTRNVFGEVTFEYIYFNNNVLEYISDAVFVNSYSTLTTWEVIFCNIPNAQGFPFDSLSSYSRLESITLNKAGVFDIFPNIFSFSLLSLTIQNCQLRYLPIGILSDLPNLENLQLNNNMIGLIEPGIFDQNSNLVNINLENNAINSLTAGTFRNMLYLTKLSLMKNMITKVDAGAFVNLPSLATLWLDKNEILMLLIDSLGYLPGLTNLDAPNNGMKYLEKNLFIGCPNLKKLNIHNNELTFIEPGMFDVFISGSIYIHNNLLTTLDENWLKTPLQNSNLVDARGNPLECGCDIAWLYVEPDLMSRLLAKCSNGTSIHDLDSSSFFSDC